MPVCPTCDRSLSTLAGVRQHHAKVHGESLPNRTCSGCGEPFYDPKSRRVFCDSCNPNAGIHNGNWGGGKTQGVCVRCESKFEYYQSDKPGRYCPTCVEEADDFLGDPFRKDAERISKQCKQCSTGMSVLQSDIDWGTGVFCSHSCHSKWMSENRIGPEHHQWEGGPLRYGGRWWSVRRRALKRDDYSCQNCGRGRTELGQEPDVHHIRRVRDFDDPEDAHFLSNVVCLCRPCHRRVEGGDMEAPSNKEG